MQNADGSGMQHDNPNTCMYKIDRGGGMKQVGVCTILITVVCSMTKQVPVLLVEVCSRKIQVPVCTRLLAVVCSRKIQVPVYTRLLAVVWLKQVSV